ncbi:hypothetical protein [Campylobacter gastrosuis]|uniref:Uncharacterized protein n=1 Tax=Campylobacter gastrosuis TaxID=2974576 RepID=A0ABT7HTU6_9BACT|nr:hypothetical protein [Campylobacter gastrosuis]MDL0090048.1 hypothetical protein [Campylobacter gastrosuis]
MQIVLNNVSAEALSVIKSLKFINPKLTIKKEYKDKRSQKQIRAELKMAVDDYKSGSLEKFSGFDEAKARTQRKLRELGAKN